MDKKDVGFILAYLILTSLVLLGSVFEPSYSDLILFCDSIYILSTIPSYLILKGYIK